MNQTAREGAQVPRRTNHFDEIEFQGTEEDLVGISEEERQHWYDVDRTCEQMKDAKCWESASKVNNVNCASFQVRMQQQEGKPNNSK